MLQHHTHLVLQLTIDGQFNQNPWRDQEEQYYYGHWYQNIFVTFQSYKLNIIL